MDSGIVARRLWVCLLWGKLFSMTQRVDFSLFPSIVLFEGWVSGGFLISGSLGSFMELEGTRMIHDRSNRLGLRWALEVASSPVARSSALPSPGPC